MANKSFIIYEDSQILVINKPTGVAVEAASTYKGYTLAHILSDKWADKPYFVVHRLDTPVSGLLLLAKNKQTAAQMSSFWQHSSNDSANNNDKHNNKNAITKIYWAVTENKPLHSEGILCHYLQKNAINNRTKVFEKPQPNTRFAKLAYQVLGSSDRYHLLAVRLVSGRHHQIRAQLSAINCPIKGDVKYGAKRTHPNSGGGIYLHALHLSLPYLPYIPHHQLSLQAMPPTAETDTLWRFFVEKYGALPFRFE